ncbi:MAG: HDOD domain-containing protein [Desulfobacterales bacterium]|nr:HDOD domain-containing protein [Desulfobacterales bacterium]
MIRSQFIVPMGELRVSANPQTDLVTVVGSCVAVGCFDKRNRIGGMVHIVLPGKRNRLRRSEKKSYYADSGLPLLLQAVLSKGGTTADLKTVVAGGASADAALKQTSIGRQNTDAVLQWLNDSGIVPDIVDTGGRLGRRITLSVDTGHAQILKNPKEAMPVAFSNAEIQSETELPESLFREVATLPPSPKTCLLIREWAHSNEQKQSDISQIILTDMVLTAQILRLCNSTQYGLPGKIASFPQAIDLLGMKRFRLICILAATRDQSSANVSAEKVAEANTHVRATAIIAALIARITALADPDELKIAALLHGLPRLMSEPLSGKAVERFAQGLSRRWHLPQSLYNALATYVTRPTALGEASAHAAILHLACAISGLLCAAPQDSRCIQSIHHKVPALLNLEGQLDHLMSASVAAVSAEGLIDDDGSIEGPGL